ncbi:MAG: RDD family protein [Oligoflexia bacterium]|nr:RDD family protein [Oligoflexia bacterium]
MLIGLALNSQSTPSATAKVNVMNRVAAKMIDILLIIAVAAILPYPLGPLLGFLYSLVADGLSFGPFSGQSVGKRIMKLRVVHVRTRAPATYRDSLLRNTPVGVATFFAIIPVWGWLILVLLGVPLMIMEVYLMVSVEAGHRLGDVMGDTEVIEYKPQTG